MTTPQTSSPPTMRMAIALGAIDARETGSLLQELVSLQPARPEAAEILRRLGEIRG